jgi:hypothetical protein
MCYRTIIELEDDDFEGWHALVWNGEDETLLHVTNSYVLALDAQRAAREWLDKQPPASRPA